MISLRRTSALVTILLFALLLAGCGGGATTEQGTTPAATDAGQPAAEQPAEAAPLAVGAQGTVGPYSLTVTSAERLAELVDPNGQYDAQKPAAGNEFLVVAIDVANDSDSPAGQGPTSFKLKDAQGTEYQAFPTNTQEYIFNMPGPVPAKGTASTKIAYEVPAGAKGFTLTWEPFVEGATEQQSAVWEFE